MRCIWGAKGCFFPDTTIHLFFGCHFQIVKDFIGQDSPPHPAVGTWIFCVLCGCLEHITTGQLHLYKTSTVIWSSLISRKQKTRREMRQRQPQELLGKCQSVQNSFWAQRSSTGWGESIVLCILGFQKGVIVKYEDDGGTFTTVCSEHLCPSRTV